MAYAASNSTNHRATKAHHQAHRTVLAKRPAKSRGRRRQSLLLLPIMAFAATMIAAVVYVSYILWPQWPSETAATINAPSIPIVIGSAAFNIPPEAIRVPVQRRPGTQTRVDLAFLWPSLSPPGPEQAKAGKDDTAHRHAESGMMNRIFVTIAASDTADPIQNLQAIYTHYIGNTSFEEHDGLIIQPFLNDTPYQGEDLIYPQKERETMSMRCSRPGLADTPGICLHERHVGDATVTFRFPRAWLSDWRFVETNIGKLLDTLQAPA